MKEHDFDVWEVWSAMSYKNPYKWVERVLWLAFFIMLTINVPIHKLFSLAFIISLFEYCSRSLENFFGTILIVLLFGGFTYSAVLSGVFDLLDILFKRGVHFKGTKISSKPYNINHKSKQDLIHPRGRRIVVDSNGKNKTLFLYNSILSKRGETFLKHGDIGDKVEGVYLKHSKIVIKYRVIEKYPNQNIPILERTEITRLVQWWNK